MTPEQLDHLRAIDAHLSSLLDIAAKRTPGNWEATKDYSDATWQVNGDTPITDKRESTVTGVRFPGSADAAFIASCSGNAEAGWRATRAAIKLCIANLDTDPEFPHHAPDRVCDNDGRCCRACGYTERMLLETLLAEWPLETLKA